MFFKKLKEILFNMEKNHKILNIHSLVFSRWMVSSISSNSVLFFARTPDGYVRTNPSASRLTFLFNSPLFPSRDKKNKKYKHINGTYEAKYTDLLEANYFDWS